MIHDVNWVGDLLSSPAEGFLCYNIGLDGLHTEKGYIGYRRAYGLPKWIAFQFSNKMDY